MGKTTFDIQEELKRLKELVGSCNDEIVNLKVKNQNVETELQQKNAHFEGEISKLQTQNRKLKEKLEEKYDKKISNILKKYAYFEGKHVKARKKISGLQTQNHKLGKKLDKKSTYFQGKHVYADQKISELQALVGNSGILNDDDMISMNHNAYTFLYTTSKIGPFFAGLIPCVMQYAVFVLFLLDLLNTSKIPPDVATIVRACQVMAIIITFLVETDMLRALRAVVYREGLEEMINEFDGFHPWKFYASNFLMGTQGLLGKVVAFFLIIFADNVFDLLLNFTAVMFVSELDEIVFMLSMAGYFDRKSEQLSKKIFKAKLQQRPPNGFSRYLHLFLYGLAAAAAMIAFIWITVQQSSQESLAEFVKVQFGDEIDPTLGLFSGCYEKQLTNGWDARVRYVQTKSDRGNGEFEYCLSDDLQTWVFANEASTTACDGKFVLRSAEERSTSFDLLDAKGDQWLLSTGNPISEFQLGAIDPTRFEIECGSIFTNASTTSSSEELCPVLTIGADDIGFSGSRDWSRTFVILKDSNGETVQYFQHPVFASEYAVGPDGSELLFFTGRRWVLASAKDLMSNDQHNNSMITDVASLFEFSDFWLLDLKEGALSFVSEAVSQGNDRGTPLGLQWYNARYADGIAFPFADISRPVDASFRCGKCNSRSNPCLYEGVCEADGTCTCRHGASGKLCEIKPLGDGVCNWYFNMEPDGYDGGDCCVATCSNAKCGVGDMGFAFGQKLQKEGTGFPNCTDESMVPLTIRLQTEAVDADEWFFDSYTVEVLCEGGAKAPLRVGLDPRIGGLLSETLHVEDKADSCFLSFIGLRESSGINISYQILDGMDSSPGTMLVMGGGSGITADNEFSMSALYSRCLKETLAGRFIDQKYLYTGTYQDRAFGWLSKEVPKNAECSSNEEYLIERYALVALSTAEEAPENWIFSRDHCLWPRVTCDGSRVVEFNYDGTTNGRLNGTWAHEFTLLRHLKRFMLSSGDFSSGTIPTEISMLTALTALITPSNHIIGTLPMALYELTSLQELTMANNDLSGSIPTEVGQLSALSILTLRSNKFSGSLPSEVGNLGGLKALDIGSNILSGTFPMEVWNLSGLSGIAVSSNSFRGTIPSEIGNMRELSRLDLSTNMLSGSIPSTIGHLRSLLTFHLQENSFYGTIPSEMGNLVLLTSLALYRNDFSGTIPSEVGYLSALKELHLNENRFSGSIPSEVENLTALTKMLCYKTKLSGSIPSGVGNLSALTELYLFDNALSGTVPTEVGMLSALKDLSLNGNSISGTIPSEVGNLVSLSVLYLFKNILSGTIPSAIGYLSALEELYLYKNRLSGSIPSEIGNLSALRILDLKHNALVGPIPSEVGFLTSLETLVLYDNPQLSGSIPSEIGNMGALTTLILPENALLSGIIPSEIGLVTSLVILNVTGNALSQTLPSEIGLLTNLQHLILSNNKLSGPLPTELVQLTNLRELDLSGNLFSEQEVQDLMVGLGLFFSCNQTTVELTLWTDNYPEETSWEIEMNDFTLVAFGSGYTAKFYAYEEKVCIPEDACIFTLRDSYMDGGPSVQITRLGKVYHIGGDFKNGVVIDICA